MDKEAQEKQKQEQAEQEKELQIKVKMDKLKTDKGKAVKIAAAAVAVAAVAVFVCVLIFGTQRSRTIAVYVNLGDVTFSEKTKQEDNCFVTFRAAAYNCLPEEWNEDGITVGISSEIYGALALDAEYSTATISFSIPEKEAARAGYREASGNVDVLWNEELLTQYGKITAIHW